MSLEREHQPAKATACQPVAGRERASGQTGSVRILRLGHLGLLLTGLVCALVLGAPAPVAVAERVSAATNPACSVLDDRAGSAKFMAEIGADERSGNVAAMKQLFLTLASAMQKAATVGPLKSAPASVQGAAKTVAKDVPTLEKAIAKATTEPELLSALEAMGKTPGVSKAESTLNSYADSVCGG